MFEVAPYIVFGVITMVLGTATLIAARWLTEQITQPWNRLLRAVDFNASSRVVTGGGHDPDEVVAEAWRLHARTRRYAGKRARRFRVAASMADGVLGSGLFKAGQWEDALAHLLPAIPTLRGIRLLDKTLARFLIDAAQAFEMTEDYASGLPLAEEALGLLRRTGPSRWTSPDYHRGILLRMSLLRNLRRFDDAITMAAEILPAVHSGGGLRTLNPFLLAEYAHALVGADRLADAVATASSAVERAREYPGSQQEQTAVWTLGYAQLHARLDEAAVVTLAEAVQLFDGRNAPTANLTRILYARALNWVGRTAEADEALAAAVAATAETAEDFFFRQNRAILTLVRAEIAEQQGLQPQALAAAQRALEQFTEIDRLRPGGWYATEFAAIDALRERIRS